MNTGNIPVPEINQVRSVLAGLKRKERGPTGGILLHELEEECERHSIDPDGIDVPYIVGSHFDYSDPNSGKFCIAISTKRLIRHPGNQCVHVDTTYKITWHGFPGTVIGFSDKNRKFHILMFCVSTTEKYADFNLMFGFLKEANPNITFDFIMADAAEACVNAAKFYWPLIIRLMCYAHVYMVSIIHAFF